MKLVTIKDSLLLKYSKDSEVLKKSTRPYVLIIRLKYKAHKYDFAVPIRSNIPAAAPKSEYFVFAELIKNIIDKNSKKIMTECQEYLDSYEQGIRPKYSTNIEYLLSVLEND